MKARTDVSKILTEGRRVDEVIARAAREAVLRHARAGNRVAVRHNGKVRLLSPQEAEARIGHAIPPDHRS